MSDLLATLGRKHDPAALNWLGMLRRYLPFIALTNLLWETLHLPLYTLWKQGSVQEQVFAILHCTGGDVLIATTTLILALLLIGNSAWPVRCFYRVAAFTVGAGVLYTIFSEWLNIVLRKSWAYSELMPVIPLIDTGLSPLLQWLLLPLFGLWWARYSIGIIIHEHRNSLDRQ